MDKEDSTQAVLAELPTKAPKQNPRKRKRGKPSSQKRVDAHRETAGQSFEAERRRKIEERTGGFSSEIPLPNLTEVNSAVTTLAVEIPIGSRGIGFAVATGYETIYSQFPQKVGALCTIFQAFRACLAQTWAVRENCQLTRNKETLNPDVTDDILVPYDLQIIRSYTSTFAVVANAISSFGWFDHNGSTYWPTQPPTPRYDDETLVPRPTFVKAEELRLLVQQLADPEVPEEDRIRFRDSNPLPGADWDEDALLTNGDMICPEGWPNRVIVMQDFRAFEAMLEFTRTKASHLAGTVDYSGRGSCNALVSRRLLYGDSSLVVANGRPIVNFGGLEDFYVSCMLDEQPLLRGALALAGEWEEPDAPPYRHEPSASRRVNIDWQRLADHAVKRSHA